MGGGGASGLRGESVGVKVGVCGFPMWVRVVASQNSPRGR
jgi:hypothetical protein